MTHFTPKNPAFEARVRESFDRQGAMHLLGAQLVHIAPGAVDIALDYRPELSQQHGYFHGGIVSTIADSAGGYAAFSLMPADSSVLTVEYKSNFLAPADGRRLVARGRVLKSGRTLAITQVDAFVVRDGHEHRCAVLLQTLMVMSGREDQPKAR